MVGYHRVGVVLALLCPGCYRFLWHLSYHVRDCSILSASCFETTRACQLMALAQMVNAKLHHRGDDTAVDFSLLSVPSYRAPSRHNLFFNGSESNVKRRRSGFRLSRHRLPDQFHDIWILHLSTHDAKAPPASASTEYVHLSGSCWIYLHKRVGYIRTTAQDLTE